MDAQLREKQITKTSIVGIIANLCLVVFKAIVGLISGSIAIVLDAVNNLTDAISSVITIVGIKLAKRKPDEDHPYGHGRVEYFSAVIISGIILAAGITSLVESVKKIINPEKPEYTIGTLIVIVVAIVVKLLLGRYVKAQGKKYNSDALVASGSDASFDAIISVVTLVGAGITMLFDITVDGFLGAAISIFIIKAGIEMLMESIGSIMGARPDAEVTKEIKSTVNSIEGVKGAFDLVLHDYGPDSAMGSVHVEVDSDITAEDFHKITKRIQLAVEEKFHVFLTVGMYAVDQKHAEERKAIRDIALQHEGALNVHGVFIDDELKYVSFDVMTDFRVDREALREDLTGHVLEMHPGYEVSIKFDTNYCD